MATLPRLSGLIPPTTYAAVPKRLYTACINNTGLEVLLALEACNIPSYRPDWLGLRELVLQTSSAMSR